MKERVSESEECRRKRKGDTKERARQNVRERERGKAASEK